MGNMMLCWDTFTTGLWMSMTTSTLPACKKGPGSKHADSDLATPISCSTIKQLLLQFIRNTVFQWWWIPLFSKEVLKGEYRLLISKPVCGSKNLSKMLGYFMHKQVDIRPREPTLDWINDKSRIAKATALLLHPGLSWALWRLTTQNHSWLG